MPDNRPDALVETDWLAENLARVKVLDGSWYLPAQKRDPKAEFAAGHIPGAQYFPIDEIADRDTSLPHMLPTAEAFARAVAALGISNADQVVAYDGAGLQSAARVWWTFRAFGHDTVAVLNGGFPKWQAEGRAVETTVQKPKPGTFLAAQRAGLVRGVGDVLDNVVTRREQVLDARSRPRFEATEAEPRAGLRGGHIPGSACLPYGELLDPASKTVLPVDQLKAKFAAAGIDLARPVVTTCGSGITASALALGLHLAGAASYAVYDGSWTEWGGRPDTPVETGPAR